MPDLSENLKYITTFIGDAIYYTNLSNYKEQKNYSYEISKHDINIVSHDD